MTAIDLGKAEAEFRAKLQGRGILAPSPLLQNQTCSRETPREVALGRYRNIRSSEFSICEPTSSIGCTAIR